MTKEQTASAITVMQAYCEGKTIESLINCKWNAIDSPCWNWDECAYRVKPGPREFWLVSDGEDYRAYDCEPANYIGQIKVREVETDDGPLTVAEAQNRGVCRFCKKDNHPYPPDNPFILNYGMEYAHQKCLLAFTLKKAE